MRHEFIKELAYRTTSGEPKYAYYWHFWFTYKGEDFEGWICQHPSVGTGAPYWEGDIRSKKIRKLYPENGMINIGYSNIPDNRRIILEAMKTIINGDFSKVLGVGHYKLENYDNN